MERGHSVITTKIVEQAMATILPRSAMAQMGIIAEEAAIEKIQAEDSVTYVCSGCGYAARDFEPVTCAVCGAPADAFQRLDKQAIEQLVPLQGAVEEAETFDKIKLRWTSEAMALLRGVPDGYQRRRAKAQIEKKARVLRIPTITRDLVEEGIGTLQDATGALAARGKLKKTGEKDKGDRSAESKPVREEVVRDGDFLWAADAVARLNRVPEGFMRTRTKERMEACARKQKTNLITLDIAEEGIAEGLRLMEEMIRQQDEAQKQGE
jgi:hypothetical protein